MKRVFMKTFLVLGAALLVLSLTGCDALVGGALDWLSAPYGYVYDYTNTGVSGATVKVYLGSTVDATKLVQSAATTTSSGFFSLTSKVDTKGGTYLVTVTAPAGSTLAYENVLITVPTTTYLFNIGAIKPKGGVYNVSGKVINVRTEDQTATGALPTAGKVELRKFGETTAAKYATIAADATYSVAGVESGTYFATYIDSATPAVWTGIPVTVSVSGGDITGLGALAYKGVTSSTSILLVLTWENTAYDIDSTSYVGTVGSATLVDYTAPSLNLGGNKVTLERDITALKMTAGAYPAETTLVESLASGIEMRFFAKGYSTASISGLDSGTSSKKPANVKLYAMCGGVHFGTWVGPLNTDENAVAMVQITGNVGGTMTIGTYGGTTPKALTPIFDTGVAVPEAK